MDTRVVLKNHYSVKHSLSAKDNVHPSELGLVKSAATKGISLQAGQLETNASGQKCEMRGLYV